MSAYITTIDHQTIQNWAEHYKGVPQLIDYPNAGKDSQGLRIDFPGHTDDNDLTDEHGVIRKISWDEFFQRFENLELAFEYLETVDTEQAANSYRFLKRNIAEL